jgi:hypothetical protein
MILSGATAALGFARGGVIRGLLEMLLPEDVKSDACYLLIFLGDAGSHLSTSRCPLGPS